MKTQQRNLKRQSPLLLTIRQSIRPDRVKELTKSKSKIPLSFKKCWQPGIRQPGFALVVTLSLMILLTIIAVGLLTLSSISIRTASHSKGMAVARANAKMALMLAIGELQRQTGPDTRVTARADVLDEENPPIVGVWKSWEGTDHETSGNFAGRPISPGIYKS